MEPLLSAIGLSVGASSIGSEGRPLPRGNHLRWSFRRDLGFPKDGFVLSKREYLCGEFGFLSRGWSHLAHLKSEDIANLDEVEARFACPEDKLSPPRAEDVGALLQTVEGLVLRADGVAPRARPLDDANPEARALSVRGLGALSLASLEPEGARGAGLAFVDHAARPFWPADYRIVARWNLPDWPFEELGTEAIQAADVGGGRVRIGDVELSSARAVYRGREVDAGSLYLFGDPSVGLKLTFPYPVAEIELAIEADPEPREWFLSNIDATAPNALRRDGRWLKIRTRPSRHFDLRDRERLYVGPSGERSLWKLRGLRFRGGSGPLETATADVQFGAFDTEARREDSAPQSVRIGFDAPSPAAPGLRVLGVEQIGARLTRDGEARTTSATVALELTPPASSASPAAFDPRRPARARLSREDPSAARPAERPPAPPIRTTLGTRGLGRQPAPPQGDRANPLPALGGALNDTAREERDPQEERDLEAVGGGALAGVVSALRDRVAGAGDTDRALGEVRNRRRSGILGALAGQLSGQLADRLRGRLRLPGAGGDQVGAAPAGRTRSIALPAAEDAAPFRDGGARAELFGDSDRFATARWEPVLDIGPEEDPLEAALTGAGSVRRARFAECGDYAAGRAIAFDGEGGAVTPVEVAQAVQWFGDHVFLDCWARIDRNARSGATPEPMTLMGAGRGGKAFWLGVTTTPQSAAAAVEFEIAGQGFSAPEAVQIGAWFRVTALYDGASARIWVNGVLMVLRAAALGALRLPARRSIGVGADAPSQPGRLGGYPFIGAIALPTIWRRSIQPTPLERRGLLAHWPLRGAVRESLSGADAERRNGGAFNPGWSGGDTRAFDTKGRGHLRQRLVLPGLSGGVTLTCVVEIEQLEGVAALVSFQSGAAVRFGLRKVGAGAQMIIQLDGRVIPSAAAIPLSGWRALGFSIDRDSVAFLVDGRIGSRRFARIPLSGLARSAAVEIVIGKDAFSDQGQFNGRISDVALWRGPAVPPSSAPLGLEGDPTRAESPTVQPTRALDDRPFEGRTRYLAQGIDLFGRLSPWSTPREATVSSATVPPPPVNLTAALAPMVGEATAISGDAVTVRLTRPAALAAADLNDLPIAFARSRGGETSLRTRARIGNAGLDGDALTLRPEYPADGFMTARVGDRALIEPRRTARLRWMWTGLQSLFHPDVDQFAIHRREGARNVIVGAASSARVAETTPGGAPVFAVGTDIAYRAEFAAVERRPCAIGSELFSILRILNSGGRAELLVSRRAYPIIEPEPGAAVTIRITDEPTDPLAPFRIDDADLANWPSDPVATVRFRRPAPIAGEARKAVDARRVDAEELARLRERGVDWLSDGKTWRIALHPDAASADAVEAAVGGRPSRFAPGCLVALSLDQEAGNPWRTLNVLWAERGEEGLALYVAAATLPAAAEDRAVFSQAVYYPGASFETEVDLGPFDAETPIRRIAFGAVSLAGETHGPVGEVFELPAVDPRLPPKGPKPTVTIGRPDVYGEAVARITWRVVEPGVRYEVMRATDADVFAVDAENRRLRAGGYRDAPTPLDVFSDDSDFRAWRQSCFPALSEDALEDLFVEDLETSPEARRFWRAWADRFYPARTEAQTTRLARRADAARAFGVVTPGAIDGVAAGEDAEGRPLRAHRDPVKALVRNRYFYAIRTVTTTAAAAPRAGEVSEPGTVDRLRPPRAPRFTGLEAGDRSLRSAWSLVADLDLPIAALPEEAALPAYELLGAQRREDLEDVRWFPFGPPEGATVIALSDPRPRLLGGAVLIPKPFAFTQIEGVFLADAPLTTAADARAVRGYFAPGAARSETAFLAPPGVMNLLPAPVATGAAGLQEDEHGVRLEGLRASPDRAFAVVTFRDEDGQVAALVGAAIVRRSAAGLLTAAPREGVSPPHLETALEGRRDVWRRVVAVDRFGNRSASEEILRARPLEIEPPEPPILILDRTVLNEAEDLIEIECAPAEPGHRVLIQRRLDGERAWATVRAWAPAEDGFASASDSAPRDAVAHYRAWSRTPGGEVSAEAAESFAPPQRAAEDAGEDV